MDPRKIFGFIFETPRTKEEFQKRIIFLLAVIAAVAIVLTKGGYSEEELAKTLGDNWWLIKH